MTSTREKAVKLLNCKEHKFYLCGSRFMREIHGNDCGEFTFYGVNDDTDWDLTVTHSRSVEDFLILEGFKKTKDSSTARYEMDSELVSIWAHSEDPMIQIQVRYDAEFYMNVVKSISSEFYYLYLWKSSPRFSGQLSMIQPIFNQLFATFKIAKKKEFVDPKSLMPYY